MLRSIPDPGPTPDATQLTRFLNELGRGEVQDDASRIGYGYAELRAIAARYLRSERGTHDLQTTALVHHAYLKLFDEREVEWAGRKHFHAVAAKAMRGLLVDEARRRKRRRQGTSEDLVTLDPRQARVVELKYFDGLEVTEVERVLDLSVSTVAREWRSARA